MSRDQWSGDEHALFNAIQQLVDERFTDLEPEELDEVFQAVVEEARGADFEGPDQARPDAGAAEPSGEPADQPEIEGGDDESSSGWTGRISDGLAVAIEPESADIRGEDAGPSSIEISVEVPTLVSGVLDQILEVGAVLVRLDRKPELNELIEMTLEFPDAHLTIESPGRVVHNSEDGTAIEMSGLGREDRYALQAMREDLEAHTPPSDGAVEDGGAESESEQMDAEDTFQRPGGISPVQESDDPRRSFSRARMGSKSPSGTHQGSGRRRVSSTVRRQVDLTDPDMNVASSSQGIQKEKGKTTREFYGPPPTWLDPDGDADRVETLSGERILDILLQLSENGFTGLMTLKVDGEDVEQLHFDGGYVVERSVRPRTTDQELGPMLLAADRITNQQLGMAAAHADEMDMTVARSLMDLGILNPDDLRHAIAGRLTFLLREFCDSSDGVIRIYQADALPAGFLPQPPLRVHVAVERIVYNRLFRRLSQHSGEEREQRMEEFLDTYPEIVEHERDRLDRAVTDEDQRQFLEQNVNGQSRMREVVTESVLGASETFAALFALHRMGLVRFDRSLHDTVVRERLRENVTVKHLSVHKASYFEVLNVHWSSYSEVVEDAYERLTDQFDPEGMPDDLEDEIYEKVEEINERLEAAYAALNKRKTRHAYRTRIMPEYKLEHAIPLFLKQCELAERRDNWANAVDAVRRVLEIDPDHEEARRKLERFKDKVDDTDNPDPASTVY